MPPAVPLIYSPIIPHVRLSWFARLAALVIGLACLVPLGIAAWLTPSSSGWGTHLALNLQPCYFFQTTGLPCPSCGMTTSWSWFARANLPASLYVQPMGTVLAVLAVVAVWTSFYIALTGRAAHRLILLLPYQYILYGLLTFGVLAWAWKIFIYKHGIDGWR